MNVTNEIRKMRNDYQNAFNIVNKSVKYSFEYNNSKTSIFYTEANGLEHQILLIICVKKIYYLTSIYFSENNGEYKIIPYIPEEIYPLIREDIFAQDNNSPAKYFEQVANTILTTNPLTSNYKDDIRQYQLYNYRDKEDRPFFQTFVRKNMSSRMKSKIKSRFESSLAAQIITYCQEVNKTLRFTLNIDDSHDIILVMKNNPINPH